MNPVDPPGPGYYQGDVFCGLLPLAAGTSVITHLIKIFPELSAEDCAGADCANRKGNLPLPPWPLGQEGGVTWRRSQDGILVSLCSQQSCGG